MLACRQRCYTAARAASKSFYQGRHAEKKQVVEGMMRRGAPWEVELPRSSWSWYPSQPPHTAPISYFSRPMLLLSTRGAKRVRAAPTPTTSTAAPTIMKPKTPNQRNEKQFPDAKSTSDWFVRWEIPWDGKRVLITSAAFTTSFLITGVVAGFVLISIDYMRAQPVDFNKMILKPDEMAFLILSSLFLQCLLGTYAIKACIKSYIPLPKELFSYDWRNPFSVRRGWLLWGIIGLLCAVATAIPTAMLTNKYIKTFSLKNEVLIALQPLIGASGTRTALVLASVGVFASFVEETFFRGFLLTSLTKWMPTYAAVLLSAGVFSLAHFSPERLPMFFALGTVIGFSYSKTGSLLTPIMIHGVWNSAAILMLTFLHRQGIDIKKVMESPREFIKSPDAQKLLEFPKVTLGWGARPDDTGKK